MNQETDRADLVRLAEELRWGLPPNFNDHLTEAIYAESSRLAERSVARRGHSRRLDWQNRMDRWLTSPRTGFLIMGLVFATVLWLTIVGANYPSSWLSWLLTDQA
jgi:ferrous iron transport protein B